jgi:8-oxo-dGTP pyrophosphatase MutT (NUDIX family)
MFKRGYETYSSSETTNIDDTEPFMNGEHIDFVQTKSLKQYLEIRRKQRQYFDDPEGNPYPLAEIPSDRTGRNALIQCWLRLEEMFGYDFGVVYKSKYNSLVVDPIKQTCPVSGTCQFKPFFPYERVIPTSGKDGVVMIPTHEGKYILIKQFRHAIRAEQYSFPRGYAENGGNPEDNAIRELQEELNAHSIGATELLGRVAPDSGLTSTQAYVFSVIIGDYSTQIGHEGILEVVELTAVELDAWIKAGKITDGFTLSAWSMYKDKYDGQWQ